MHLRQLANPWVLGAVVDGNTTELAVLAFARKHLHMDTLPLIRKALSGITTVICDCKLGHTAVKSLLTRLQTTGSPHVTRYSETHQKGAGTAAVRHGLGARRRRSRLKPQSAMALAAMANLRAAATCSVLKQSRQATFGAGHH